MCKSIIAALALLQGVTTAGTLTWVNLSGEPITNASVNYGAMVAMPGQTAIPITADVLTFWQESDMSGYGLDETNDWLRVDTQGANLLHGVTRPESEKPWPAFWSGFVLVFLIGFVALGARWTRIIIGGGGAPE